MMGRLLKNFFKILFADFTLSCDFTLFTLLYLCKFLLKKEVKFPVTLPGILKISEKEMRNCKKCSNHKSVCNWITCSVQFVLPRLGALFEHI